MEYYPESLDQLAKKAVSLFKGRQTEAYHSFAAWAFRSIIRSVEEVHKLGYVHRDLKLDNFMVDAQCNPRLIQITYTSTTLS